MIKSMNGLTLRFFKYNKFTSISSMLSILLSIFLIITISSFSLNAKQSLIQNVKKMYGDMDLAVGYNIGEKKIIDQSLFDAITKHPGIKQASGVLNAKLWVEPISAEIYTVGIDNDPLVKSRYHIQQDLTGNEVILNQGLADAIKVGIGDTISIENQSFKIKEILTEVDAMGVMPDILILPNSTLRQILYDKSGSKNIVATYILIKKSDNVDVYTLAEQLRQMDKDLRIDLAEENDFLKQNLTHLTRFMTVLSVLMLIVISLFTISNFEVLLYKYKNQFAIMRSIGSTTKQLFQVVFRQSFLINIIGAGLGFLLALASHQFLLKWLGNLFSVSISTIEFPFLRSIIVTVISMLIIQMFLIIPCLRAAKILPIRMMQDNEKSDFSNPKLRKRFGFALIFCSLMLIGIWIMNPFGTEGLILIAALLMVSAILILYAVYVTPILTWLLPILRTFFGNASYVAVKNVIPQVRKNTFIMLTICTMMTIAVFGSTLLKTIETNNEKYLLDQYVSDIVVTSRLSDSKINPSELRNAIQKLQGVKHVSIISSPSSVTLMKNSNKLHSDYLLVDLDEMVKQGLFPANIEYIENGIVVTKEVAEKLHLKNGDKIQLSQYSNDLQQEIPKGEATIVQIVDKLPGSYYEIYIDWKNETFINEFTDFSKAFISTVNVEITLQQIEELRRQYPELKAHTLEEAKEQYKQFFQERWFLFIAVMIVIVLSVMLGVVNSLMNNIHTKRKEFAILRVISLDKKGIRQVILTQVLLYILIGLVLGIITGILLTLIVSIIDPGVYFDIRFISIVAGVMTVSALFVFIPYAKHIGNREITIELTQDNK